MKRREKKSESLEIRLPYSQKQAFMEACRERGVTASDVLRDFIADDLDAAAQADKPRSWNMTIKNNPLKTAASLAGAALAAATFGTGASLAEDKVFASYDRNGDGLISYSEFAANKGAGEGEYEEHVEKRVVRTKRDTGEVVTVDVMPAPPAPTGNPMGKLFDGMDTDGDGFLDQDEFEGKGTFSKRSIETTERDGNVTKVIVLERVSYDIEDDRRRSISINAESRTVDPDANEGEIEQAFRELEQDMIDMERGRPVPPAPPAPGE